MPVLTWCPSRLKVPPLKHKISLPTSSITLFPNYGSPPPPITYLTIQLPEVSRLWGTEGIPPLKELLANPYPLH